MDDFDTTKSVVCIVTQDLYPLGWLTDWALESYWRACNLASDDHRVLILWMPREAPSPESREQARGHYRNLGVDLLIADDDFPDAIPRDLVLKWPIDTNVQRCEPVLRQLCQQYNPHVIELPVQEGLPLRVLQAWRADLAYRETEIRVNLTHIGEKNRYHQRQLRLTREDVLRDFRERESVELAEHVFTIEPRHVEFLEQIGWHVSHVQTRRCPRPPSQSIMASSRLGGLPTCLGGLELDSEFGLFVGLIRHADEINHWLYVDTPNSSTGQSTPLSIIEQAAKNTRSQVACVPNNNWQETADALRERNSIVVYATPEITPRLAWLVNHGVRFVFPDALLDEMARDHQEELVGRLTPLSYQSHHIPSATRALSHAQHHSEWTQFFDDWNRVLLQRVQRVETSKSQVFGARVTSKVTAPPRASDEVISERVTIAVSHYNLGRLLPETLKSLQNQTYLACDVVVVDDGSTDAESIEVWNTCRSQFPEFEFVQRPHVGYWGPRNYAIEHCVNRFIIIVDGDNIAVPRMAATLVHAMQCNPGYDACSSYVTSFEEDRQRIEEGQFKTTHAPVGGDVVGGFFANVFGDTNSIFRVSKLREIGGFRENFDCAYGDWEVFQRLTACGGQIGVIPEVLLHYRVHAGAMTQRRHKYYDYWTLLAQRTQLTNIRPADWRRLSFALYGLT